MAINIIFSFLMLFVCVSSGCITENEPEGAALVKGDKLPHFSVVLNTGEEVTTESLQGLWPVIVFFNTGCGDCRKELPVVQSLWEMYKESPEVKIVAIAREESEEEIAAYWKEAELSLPFSPQPNRDVYSLFAPSVIPRIYIADPEGVIIATFDDNDMPSLSQLESYLPKP